MHSSADPARFPGLSQYRSNKFSNNPGGNASDVRAGRAAPSATGPVLAPRVRRGTRLRLVQPDESGTTTAEYTVVTAAAVAFGALLLKLLTGSWGEKILETAFREVIKMLGF